jgi:mRNA interferase MazF
MPNPSPLRGEVWFADLDPPHQLEQAGAPPCLVPSHTDYNKGRSGRVIIIPFTKNSRQPFTVSVSPPEGGLKMESYLLCDQIRAINKDRLSYKLGSVSAQTLRAVKQIIEDLLDF